MRQGKKIHTVTIGLLCLTTLSIGACVTRSTYDTAAADLEVAKAELHSTRTQTQGLTQQVNDLQQRQTHLARQMEVSLLALRQAVKQMKAERMASQKRLSTLIRTTQQLSAQQKSLRYVFKRETKEQVRLQSAVDSYKSKQGEAERLSASLVTSPAESANEPAKTVLVPPAQTPVANEPAQKPTVMTTAASVNPPLVAPKPTPARIQPPEPVEEDWVTFIRNWISSLLQSVVFF